MLSFSSSQLWLRGGKVPTGLTECAGSASAVRRAGTVAGAWLSVAECLRTCSLRVRAGKVAFASSIVKLMQLCVCSCTSTSLSMSVITDSLRRDTLLNYNIPKISINTYQNTAGMAGRGAGNRVKSRLAAGRGGAGIAINTGDGGPGKREILQFTHPMNHPGAVPNGLRQG
jgi:hypothetical protein